MYMQTSIIFPLKLILAQWDRSLTAHARMHITPNTIDSEWERMNDKTRFCSKALDGRELMFLTVHHRSSRACAMYPVWSMCMCEKRKESEIISEKCVTRILPIARQDGFRFSPLSLSYGLLAQALTVVNLSWGNRENVSMAISVWDKTNRISCHSRRDLARDKATLLLQCTREHICIAGTDLMSQSEGREKTRRADLLKISSFNRQFTLFSATSLDQWWHQLPFVRKLKCLVQVNTFLFVFVLKRNLLSQKKLIWLAQVDSFPLLEYH